MAALATDATNAPVCALQNAMATVVNIGFLLDIHAMSWRYCMVVTAADARGVQNVLQFVTHIPVSNLFNLGIRVQI